MIFYSSMFENIENLDSIKILITSSLAYFCFTNFCTSFSTQRIILCFHSLWFEFYVIAVSRYFFLETYWENIWTLVFDDLFVIKMMVYYLLYSLILDSWFLICLLEIYNWSNHTLPRQLGCKCYLFFYQKLSLIFLIILGHLNWLNHLGQLLF